MNDTVPVQVTALFSMAPLAVKKQTGKIVLVAKPATTQSGTKSGNEFHLTLKENLKAGKASKKGGGALSRRNSTTSAGANTSTSGKGSSGANRRNSSGVTSKMLEPQVSHEIGFFNKLILFIEFH